MQPGSAKFYNLKVLMLGLVLALVMERPMVSASELSSGLSKDPIFRSQWAVKNTGQSTPIDLDSNHTIEQNGKPGVDMGWVDTEGLVADAAHPTVVAVIDSGLDQEITALSGRIQPGGKDFCDNLPVNDPIGHGTHVAGIIAGISPSSVKILPLRILHPKTRDGIYHKRLVAEYAADAINYAVAQGASVINMSLGWPKIVDSKKSRDAVENALKSGVLIVAAAGNDRKDLPTYPCAYSGVLCVGAQSNNGEPAFFSDLGGEVDLTAPGDGIISAFPKSVQSRNLRIDGYERLNGTSQAAPFVSGIAATLKAVHPEMSLNELKAHLLSSAGLSRNPDVSLYGMVNLKRALDPLDHSVYLPEFKSAQVSIIEKASLISGSFPLNCYGPCSDHPHFQMKSKEVHVSIDSAELEKSPSDASWTFSFTGKIDLTRASEKIPVEILNDQQEVVWSGNLRVSRSPQEMSQVGRYVYPKAGLPLLRLLGEKNYSTLQKVENLFDPHSVPEYFGVFSHGKITLVRPSQAQGLNTLSIPENERVGEVIKVDANLDQSADYVILGYTQDDEGNVTQMNFHFFQGSDFSPLYGPYSTWKVDFSTDPTAALAVRNFGKRTSWTVFPTDKLQDVVNFHFPKTVLVPSFIAEGKLPQKDNYDEFTFKHFETMNHYYYLEPIIQKSAVTLSPRAVDSSSFYETVHSRVNLGAQESVHLIDFLSPSKILISVGNQFDQRYFIWKISSTKSFSEKSDLIEPFNISATHLSGQSQAIQTSSDENSMETGFSEFFDVNGKSARLIWANSENKSTRQADIQSLSTVSPLMGTIGFGSDGGNVFALVKSRYDLIAVEQKSDGRVLQSAISIDRESSFSSQDFQNMVSPILFANSPSQNSSQNNPLSLGAYIDSTRLVGDIVGTAAWDPETDTFRKQARYSMKIPANCAPMSAYASQNSGALTYSILCDETDHWEFRYVAP